MFANRLFYLLLVVLFSVSACVPAPQPTSLPTSIAAGVSSTSESATSTSSVALAVTSTLDGLTTLPHRIVWEAKPTVPESQISEVDFLIDNQIAFVEQHEPYTYGRDGNYLVTSFLKPGEHSFTVRVITHDDQRAESTVKATVEAAPNPPDELANTSWTHEMTDSDRQKATSSEPPPLGQWGLTIDSVGWTVHDPEAGGLLFDVEYQSNGGIEFRPTIEEPPYPSPTGGAFCDEPDPSILWTYTISDGGKTLTLHPASEDPCGDRLAILEGTWNRNGN